MDVNQILATAKLPFVFLGEALRSLYTYVLPEYPEIGVWILLATLLVVWYQMRKVDTGRAIEIGIWFLIGASVTAFLAHLVIVLMKRGGASF